MGSIVSGRGEDIFVEENEHVKKGQKLAAIETGFGDSEVREAEGAYERALAELEYQELNYERKKRLFEEHFLSDAELESARRDYRTTLADVKALKATFERKMIAYKSNTVHAPVSGMIIRIDAIK